MANAESHRAVTTSLALPAALVATTFLFWLMQFLIDTGVPAMQKAIRAVPIEFVRAQRDERVQTKERKLPDKPVIEEVAPPPPSFAEESAAGVAGSTAIGIAPPAIDRGITLNRQGFEPPSDAEAVPLVRIPPDYPLGAQMRGIEGWVMLAFTINEIGRVENATVVEAEPKGVFDTAAINALLRWRYKPKIENGRPVKWYDNRVVITFTLPEAERPVGRSAIGGNRQ
ncbi:MAG: TonB family protein [Rhodospirillaceae bacterium]|nr:TonB family protein [Rhodospirillaceae bacterium]